MISRCMATNNEPSMCGECNNDECPLLHASEGMDPKKKICVEVENCDYFRKD